MDLKFSFSGGPDKHDHGDQGGPSGGGVPLPFAGASSGSPLSTSSVLELRVSLVEGEMICEGLSGDGVSYASAQKQVLGDSDGALAAALRSVLARCGAELPEPLIASVTGVVLRLGGREPAVLRELGLAVAESGAQLASVDDGLQARTGIAVGTPISR